MAKTKDFAWEDELSRIVRDYKEKEGYGVENEALDGDETERLAEILLVKLDLMEGNITEKEYLGRLKNREEVKARLKCKKCKKEFKIEIGYMRVVTCPYCSEYIRG